MLRRCRLSAEQGNREGGEENYSPWIHHLIGKVRDDCTVPMNYQERITLEPGKRGGKPCVRGLRITVYDVLPYLA